MGSVILFLYPQHRTQVLIFLIAAVALLSVTGLLIAARLRATGHAVGEPCDVSKASVSLIIPARNEEHNLPKLLASLGNQRTRLHELIVIDDGSTDRTAEIAKSHGARVITSEPLPEAWRGKTWACHQGALAATGELLIFMDADTWFEVGGLDQALARYRGGAFSIGPYHAVEKNHEDYSLFFNLAMSIGTLPRGLFGQFLMIGREAYERIGGHAFVRGKVLENFRLATACRKNGIAVQSMNGRGMIAFRMYADGMSSLIEGWTKGFASGANHTPRNSLLLVVAWMSALMIPPLAGCLSGEWRLWGPVCALAALQVIWIGRMLGSFRLTSLALYPLPLAFFFALFTRSTMMSGKKVRWKGRDIHAD
jgi:4,4'-diaponeurosporenoate glycosyltransferase